MQYDAVTLPALHRVQTVLEAHEGAMEFSEEADQIAIQYRCSCAVSGLNAGSQVCGTQNAQRLQSRCDRYHWINCVPHKCCTTILQALSISHEDLEASFSAENDMARHYLHGQGGELADEHASRILRKSLAVNKSKLIFARKLTEKN